MWPAVPTTIERVSEITRSASALSVLPLAAAGTLRAALVGLRGRAAAARSALALAHALQDLHQPEIDLPLLHVDADHLHAHLVAQPVNLVRVLAAQQMRAL